ncbi:AMP-binding protein [Bosea robiniae]|uniref:Fatty-acyl-CoA synthase n=1 Tax=Bosea robiniae TaxID=1036780 RepID=A0ABY0P4C5_9HYPH|nr:AMP-binding protein [Bosea robiniae]SDH24350.1 fatty-acyl-CoA synthase [Bosea robiniae]
MAVERKGIRPVALGGWIDNLALQHGEAPALFDEDRPVSYAQLARRSRRLAAGLARLGIGQGDRVAVWLPNCSAWIETLLGCGRLGAIVVSLNTRFRAAEVGDILGRSGARALVMSPDFAPIAYREILANVPPAELAAVTTIVTLTEEAAPVLEGRRQASYASLLECGEWDGPAISPATGCLILTTSGTTKKPKFVLHSQQGLVTHAFDVAAAPGFYGEPGSAGMSIMPLCGAFGLTQTIGALAGGAPTVLMRSFDPEVAAAAIRQRGVTNMAGVDDVFYRLLQTSDDAVPFPELRFVVFGSFNNSSDDFVRAADQRGLLAVGAYGMSEFQGLFSLQPREAGPERRARGGGHPVSAAAIVRVRDPDTGRLLAVDESGELEVAAPSMMLGYFGDPEATAAAFTDDGFLRTGDAGCLRADGSFEFHARMNDALRLGGFLVSPAEIAEMVASHPMVSECQVVGAHGPDGYRAVAFVIAAEGGFAEAAVQEHCRGRLAKFKQPARILAVDTFPATDGPNGPKVQRNLLRAMAEAALKG